MQNFDFNTIPLNLTNESGTLYVFDSFRKKKILLTPEEEVRQKLLLYLVETKKISPNLIAIERGIKVNKMIKRFDILVFNNQGQAELAIECKAPSVKLSQSAMQQLAFYNTELKARYLLVTNGFHHVICEVNFETRKIIFLEQLPF